MSVNSFGKYIHKIFITHTTLKRKGLEVVISDNFFIICSIEVEIENKAINRKKLKLFKIRIDKIRILWYNIYSKGGEKIDI